MAIRVLYRILEDGTKAANASATIIAGRPVTVNDSGEVIAATDSLWVYGIAKDTKCTELDETAGAYGAYGSGKMTVVCMGLVAVAQSILKSTTYAVFANRTYHAGETLYANAGLIDNVDPNVSGGAAAKKTLIGTCTKLPSSTTDSMELLVRPISWQ